MGNTEYTSPNFLDMTKTDDLAIGVDFIQKQSQDANLVGVGLSLGANTMLRYAGDPKHSDHPIKALVSVNNPFDIWLAINLMRGNSFEKHMLKELRTSMFSRSQDPALE